MTATYEQLDLDTIRQRTQHGLPITQEQQRWLVEQASGPLEGKKTRCPLCEGQGRLYASVLDADLCTVTRWMDCEQCGGDGYILEQPKSDAGKKYGITAERLDTMVIEDMQDYFRHEFGEIPDWLKKHDGRPLYQTVRMALRFCLCNENTKHGRKTCRACKEEIGESVGDSNGLCQMCWEALTGYSWWDEVMGEPIGIEADICREIARRQKMGQTKYGQQLADNPADIAERLQHIKEELLDGAIYCQWAIGRLKDEKGSSASHI